MAMIIVALYGLGTAIVVGYALRDTRRCECQIALTDWLLIPLWPIYVGSMAAGYLVRAAVLVRRWGKVMTNDLPHGLIEVIRAGFETGRGH